MEEWRTRDQGAYGSLFSFITMENYRMELDALNALVRAQNRTNELLEKLLERGDNLEVSHIESINDSTTGGERSVHNGPVEGRSVQQGNRKSVRQSGGKPSPSAK